MGKISDLNDCIGISYNGATAIIDSDLITIDNMATIKNLGDFNNTRRDLMKIKTINDEVILFTKEEAKAALVKYISEELEIFADDISGDRKKEVETRINFKLRKMENELVAHINEKIDKITERIVTLTVNRVIDEEVNKRLEAKLTKIKNSL